VDDSVTVLVEVEAFLADRCGREDVPGQLVGGAEDPIVEH
jgi:hypothetical protein